MVDWHTARQESWRFELVTRDGEIVESRLPVEDASFDWETGRGAGGRFTLAGDHPSLRGRLIRPVYIMNGVEYPLGLFRGSAAPVGYGAGTKRMHQVAVSEHNPLAPARLVGSLTLPAGTPVLSTVRGLATEAGVELAVESPTNDETLRSEMAFPDDAALQRDVLDKLLAAIGYRPIRSLSTGPFRPVTERPVGFDFRDDTTGIYDPKFTVDTNYLSVPNRVRMVASSSAKVPALVAWAEDNNPDSPWSYPTTGEWVTETVTDVAAASPNALRLIARQELQDRQQLVSELQFQCAWVPDLQVEAVVGFSNKRHGVSGLWEVASLGWSNKTGDLVSVTARSIA